MTRLNRHLSIDGRVQGVGFRWALKAEASRLGLCGWVRNRSDGSVEALACGDAEAVEALTAWVHRGPPAARVDRVRCHDLPDSGNTQAPSGFVQHPTL